MGRNLFWRKTMRKLSLCSLIFLYSVCFTAAIDTASNILPAEDNAAQEVIIEENSSLEIPVEKVPIPAPPLEEAVQEFKVIDIEVIDHDLIEYYKRQYLTDSAKKWLSGVMKAAAPYRAFVIKELQAHGLPLCLQYLPVIESNYKLTALSKSGAAGMWQFMKNSIAPFNIRVNDWMDERRDPWLSTTAAVRKLKENYTFFDDWYLALASYNAGLGAISRTIKSAGKSDYWYLADKGLLKNETRHYVPKFLAIAEILENHDYYGIEFPDPDLEHDDSVQFDEIVINQAIALDLLAEKTSLSSKLLAFYNPALYYGITPIESSYRLRLPKGTAGKAAAVIKTDSFSLMRYSMYTVKSGDTLYALSLHYGIGVSTIQKINNLSSTKIIIGQKILIPSFSETPEYQGNKPDETLRFDGSYIVQKSDTLWSIALAYDVQVEQLAQENNMTINDVLRIGSNLKVPIID